MDICPVCGEKEVTTKCAPDRKIQIHPAKTQYLEGDKVFSQCGFCGWWSEATYSKSAPPPLAHTCGPRCFDHIRGEPEPVHNCKLKISEAYKPGPGWVYKMSSPLSSKKRERLEDRLKKLKKKRAKRGFK